MILSHYHHLHQVVILSSIVPSSSPYQKPSSVTSTVSSLSLSTNQSLALSKKTVKLAIYSSISESCELSYIYIIICTNCCSFISPIFLLSTLPSVNTISVPSLVSSSNASTDPSQAPRNKPSNLSYIISSV